MTAALKFLCSFFTDGFPLVLMAVPFYLFLRVFLLRELKRENVFFKINPVREAIMLAFFVFLILLFTQTFVVNVGMSGINIIPFKIIIKQFGEINYNLKLYVSFIFNIIGNIVIFMPIGVFSNYLFKTDFKYTALFAFLISLTIEGTQLSLERMTDVDDLILNTSGAILGYGIYKSLKLKTEKFLI